ncbi:MAG: hypothetical protein JSS86_15310 [Cyanobacteria bacterium SZAS LIN-2]|nr:hypothetical protein [Cyanobacteria bacterium SZAS LIN-2]
MANFFITLAAWYGLSFALGHLLPYAWPDAIKSALSAVALGIAVAGECLMGITRDTKDSAVDRA